MRPESIVWFERLYIASLAIAAAVVAMGWDSTGRIPTIVLLAGIALGLLLPLVLVLLVSRRRSGIAKWVLVALFLLGLAANLATYDPGKSLRLDITALLTTAMQMLALALLFTAPARAWLARRDGASGRTIE